MKLNPSKNSPAQDVVYTPVPLAVDIIRHYEPTGVILDPCMGDGAFYLNFPTDSETLWCELDQGMDFFNHSRKCDWIITNPPWSKMRTFLQHSMTLAKNIVFLTSINHYATKARLRDMLQANFGIKEFYCFDTPKSFPQSGFQLAAVHTQLGYTGPSQYSFSREFSSYHLTSMEQTDDSNILIPA